MEKTNFKKMILNMDVEKLLPIPEIRKRVAANLHPFNYVLMPLRLQKVILGNEKEQGRIDYENGNSKIPVERYKQRLALLSKALGEDTGVSFDTYFTESPYRPTIGDEPDNVYYTLRVYNTIEEFLCFTSHLGRFSLSRGFDGEEEYIAIYDNWCLNPLTRYKKGDPWGVSKSFKIYDRIYEHSPIFSYVKGLWEQGKKTDIPNTTVCCTIPNYERKSFLKHFKL